MVYAKPFFYDSGSSLTSFVTSASSASSGFPISGNIADLRTKKFQQLNEKQPAADDEVPNFEQDTNEVAPSLLQKKINKVLGKLRFIYELSSGSNNNNDANNNNNSNNDDDFDMELEDFDKEFENDNKNRTDLNANDFFPEINRTEAIKGYVYGAPEKIQESVQEKRFNFDPASIGVYFLELIGSLVGLTFGAAAQMNYQSTTKSPLDFN